MSKEKQTTPKRKSAIVKILKVLTGVILALLLLVIISVGTAVWILTPERLTPIVNETATENLNAKVEAERVELTFWSSFPRLDLDIEGLTVVSRSLNGLDSLQRATLPQDADTLLTLRKLHGEINIASLLTGKIALYDVELTRPAVNIVQVDSVTSNYNIAPPSQTPEAEEPEDEATPLPDISINRFTIIDGFPIKFTSVADSLKVGAQLTTGEIVGENQPLYTLQFDGDAGAAMQALQIPTTTFGLDGKLTWNIQKPERLAIDEFVVSAGGVALQFDAQVQMLDTLAVDALKVSGKEIAIAEIIKLIPTDMRGELSKLQTDMKFDFSATLLDRFIPSGGKMPRVKMELEASTSSLKYDKLHLTKLDTEIEGVVDLHDIDRSKVDIRQFSAKGRSIECDLTAHIERPLSDPLVDGTFHGLVNFNNIPRRALEKLPVSIQGTLSGDADYKLRLSYLDPKKFHKIKVNGHLQLRQFVADMKDGSARLFTNHTQLKLGTSSSRTMGDSKVDSLLTASLNIDTLSATMPGITLSCSGVAMGVGTRNVASALDSTQINPIGASIRAKSIALRSDSDSIRAKVADAHLTATLQRYNSDARAPQMLLSLDTRRLQLSDPLNRFILRNASLNFDMHPKKRRKMSKAMQEKYDSVAAVHPELSGDTIMKIARRHMPRRNRQGTQASEPQGEQLDFGIDNSLRTLLRTWQAKGTIKAKRARLFTPYFPLRNSISNLDLTVSTDSILLRNTTYKVGKSDMLLNGSITNISRALTSKRGVPLEMSMKISCDTLNVNEITRALMVGASFAEKVASGEAKISQSESEEVVEQSINSQIDTTARQAILVPSNIKANLSVRAKNIIYGGIEFKRFTGNIDVQNGAVHLRRLNAFTPLGSFKLTALYSAPNIKELNFAGGLTINRLDLYEFLHILPQVDSIIPMLNSLEGIIDAECAISTELDSMMNFKFHTLDMAMKISGKELVLLDNETFRTISKWLLFKNKEKNLIDSMSVEFTVRDNMLEIYPFLFNIDRYRLGFSGSNDISLNLDYHVAVLKSPIPFKFGINIKGTPENMKIRLGKARFNEKQVATTRNITDTARVNLLNEIQNVFRLGLDTRNRNMPKVRNRNQRRQTMEADDTISAADSVYLIREDILPRPKGWVDPDSVKAPEPKGKKKFMGIF